MSDPNAPQWELFCEELTRMIHGLKTPLDTVVAATDDLEGDAVVRREHAGEVERIRRAAKQALDTVVDLLDLTAVEPGQPLSRRTASSPSLVLNILAARRRSHARDRQISVSCGPRCEREIGIDVDLISRIVDNLLDNAFRYTPEGGRIEMAAVDCGDRIRIEIGNTGPAIPEDLRERVFTKYGQGSVAPWRANLGLGLYFSRRAVEALGGAMRVESSPQLPTLFLIEIPVDGARPS